MLVLLLVGAQGAWADLKKSETGNDVCSPVVHFKLPDGWTSAYLMIAGQGVPFPNPRLTDNGWAVLDLGSTRANDDTYFFINGVNQNDCNAGRCVTRNGVNVKPNNARIEGFKCSDVGTEGEIWIQEHPDKTKEGQVYVTTTKPVVKDFYVFLPDNKTWKSATPMIDEDGKPHELYVDNEHCGWYYRRYILDGKIDKALPSSVILYRDDDANKEAAIGMGGEKALEEGSAPEPIVLADLFMLFEQDPSYHDAVYFLADQAQADALGGDQYGWSATQPAEAEGNCSYNLAAVIYDTDAQLHPLFSCYADGAKEGNDGCQTRTESQKAIYSCIGVRQGLVEDALSIENGKKKMKLTTAGKACFLDQGTFDQMFNMTKGVNEMSCYDMTFTRSKDGKWEFDSDNFESPGLKTPVRGGFYPVEATTDSAILAADASQTPAPLARTKRFAEGPVFYGPLLRVNDPTEQIPKIDVYCKGPGWNKTGVSFDCEGLFADGDGTTARINSDLKIGAMNQDACVFGWSCDDRGNAPEDWPFYTAGTETKNATQGTGRWQSDVDAKSVNGGRNQHFCFESHASFRFKKNLKFNFRGDDDIWVFIDNKLAVDLGGTHLAAPGYVDVDSFMKKTYSNLDEIVGKSFDIDIFFCDRRTTMSNVRIKTNMFIEQTTGITTEGKQDQKAFIEKGDNVFKLCYKKSGNGSCAAALGAGGGEEVKCGDQIKEKITYLFTQDKTGQDPTKTKVTSEKFETNPVQYNGGIDVSKPYAPVINDSLLQSALPSGKYFLIIMIGNDKKAIEINLKGTLAVANREAVAIDDNNNKSFPYEFKSQAMASQLKDDGTPDIDQMIPLYIAAILDPCNGTDCGDPLEMQLSPGADYSLEVDNSKAQFYAMKDGKLTPFSPAGNRKVSDGGIDTIYVTIPFDEMDKNPIETVHVNVKGSTRKAEIKFFVPRLVFVDTDSTFKVVTGDKNSDDPRMKGSTYNFYLVALNADDSPCTECNFKLTRGSRTSEGVMIIDGGEVVNGRAKITIQSSKEFCREGEGPKCKGAATLHVFGPSPLTQATYDNMVFNEPPVPYPLFADIFDVHGAKSESAINVPAPYYSADKEYLDGIGDSVVIYYHREFHKDSLPDNIAVFWESEKDSVLFDHAEIVKGAACGTAKGAKTDSTCLARITLGGKQFSKDVKTNGTGTVKSWISCAPRGVPVTLMNKSAVLDRIAPLILSARAVTDTAGGKQAQLRITFSENVEKTDLGDQQDDKVFSFYINAAKEHHYVDYIPVQTGLSYPRKLDSVQTFLYSQTSEFPQAGDYIHFRGINGTGLMMDQSKYKDIDTLLSAGGFENPRAADEYNWNIAPAYDSDPSVRVPSPWALITGAVNAYAVRLMPDAIGSIPLTPSEAAKLPDIEAFTFDAYKDESDFKKAMINKDASVDPNLANYGFVPHGWFIKSDMSALIVQDTMTQAAIGNNYASVYFNYELQFFTNLGSHVVTKTGRIYCDDKKNMEENKKHFFEGKNCVEKPKNFYIVWNMKSDKQRLVGSGAYIAKLKTYVQLGNIGKKNKNDKTQMWGVRHNTKVIGNLNVENSN